MDNGETISAQKQDHFQRYLNYAVSIIEKYNGAEPFHLYLKKYFSEHKKHGSGDRKKISSLCYEYFRIGKAVSNSFDVKEKILLASFLTGNIPVFLLNEYHKEWLSWIQLSLTEKIEKVSLFFSIEKLFPFRKELSKEIDFSKFNRSFLTQPRLFIRIRPGKAFNVFNNLKSAGILFETINENCLAFNQNEKITGILKIDKEAVIQDYNSQRVADFFLPVNSSEKYPLKVWDCCAASGGKSILAFDHLQKMVLTVSDKRKGILDNLKLRFSKAGIKNYQSFVADLSLGKIIEEIKVPQDFIMADVPCSGSGTWSRTPEQLLFFSENKINEYAHLQIKIVTNAVKYLSKRGYLLYITCSVFKKENEENVNYFQENLNLDLVKSGYLKGYEMKADTLFAALFTKKIIHQAVK